MLTRTLRSIVTDHYLLDQWILDKPGPATDTKLGVHILPMAFPCTLAMIRKVAMCVTPWCAEFPDQEAQRVKASSSKQQALDSWVRIV